MVHDMYTQAQSEAAAAPDRIESPGLSLFLSLSLSLVLYVSPLQSFPPSLFHSLLLGRYLLLSPSKIDSMT